MRLLNVNVNQDSCGISWTMFVFWIQVILNVLLSAIIQVSHNVSNAKMDSHFHKMERVALLIVQLKTASIVSAVMLKIILITVKVVSMDMWSIWTLQNVLNVKLITAKHVKVPNS